MSWVIASRPEPSVTARGVIGQRQGRRWPVRQHTSRRLTFRCCCVTLITAFFVTSAPVPAVVGIATNGSGGPSNSRPLPTTSRYSITGPEAGTSAAIAFPASITAPPPEADHRPDAVFLRQMHSLFDIFRAGSWATDSVVTSR